jgi:formate dehydrogenase subunit delta
MDDSDTIRMVNQIADFFRPYPREEAVAGIAEHIKAFWEPRMCKQLGALIAAGGAGLSELSLAGAKAALA